MQFSSFIPAGSISWVGGKAHRGVGEVGECLCMVGCRDCPIHRRLWVLKAHDGKSQASNYFVEKFLDLEVAFRESTYYICDLKGNDLLTDSHGTDLYSIILQDTNSPNPICLMAKVTSSQAWLCHHRLSYLNFDTINLLSKNNIVVDLPKLKFVKDHMCSSCELGKSKRKSFQSKIIPSSKRRLQLLHMDLCGPMRVASLNGKKYVLIQALVDGKKIIITEASIRRDLRLDDVVGTACILNAVIFQELTRMSTMVSAIICLANNQKFNFTKYILDNMTNQAAKIKKLKKRVKKLEGGSKQGRIAEIHVDEDLSLIDVTAQDQGMMNDEDLFGFNDLVGDEVIVDVTASENVEQDTLMEIKAAKPMEKGLQFKSQVNLEQHHLHNHHILHRLKTKRIVREKNEANRAVIEEWDDVQAIIDESAKRHRLEKENDTAELKRCLEIVPEDDDVIIKATPLSCKSSTIHYYKIYKEGKKSYIKIIKADGNSQNYLTFGTMFKNFNREDLEVLRSIMKERFKKTKPVYDMDNLLFQTLKTIFEHHVEDNI
nr:retrovirus-related Pol polyprotein from transposon TNT 1-94 [Tanacetum cinerariifolium]